MTRILNRRKRSERRAQPRMKDSSLEIGSSDISCRLRGLVHLCESGFDGLYGALSGIVVTACKGFVELKLLLGRGLGAVFVHCPREDEHEDWAWKAMTEGRVHADDVFPGSGVADPPVAELCWIIALHKRLQGRGFVPVSSSGSVKPSVVTVSRAGILADKGIFGADGEGGKGNYDGNYGRSCQEDEESRFHFGKILAPPVPENAKNLELTRDAEWRMESAERKCSEGKR